MKVLLTAINAKYIHSNLAVYYLREYASDYKDIISIAEYTINQNFDDILQAIYKEQPDIIAFSSYIWNIDIIERLCKEIRKILADTKIWLGGPEVSYDGKAHLKRREEIDGIILGEGEETFKELLDYYNKDNISLNEVKGIVFRESAKKEGDILDIKSRNNIFCTKIRPVLDFSKVPFAYKDFFNKAALKEETSNFRHKIIYYETSRGCPFSCSYCLSSVDKKIRLRDLDLVKKELDLFLFHKVKQVKFIDRTFNCNKEHALAIWNYIKDKDNGITNFHFEIAADLLDEEQIQVMDSMRVGLIQLEIGVQSTNPITLKAIRRKTNFDKISKNVKKVYETRKVHQHLDLIAGLPYEDYNSFRDSFNDVYLLRPDQLQLGFLKLLKGSPIYEESKEYGIVYKDIPPYEVLFTSSLSYQDVIKLKMVEEMVEVYYNSGQFTNSIIFMEHFFDSPFDLYKELGNYYMNMDLLLIKHSRIRRYEILLDFMMTKTKEVEGFKEILLFDLYLREGLKSRPSFAIKQDNSDYEHKEIYRKFYKDEDMIFKYLGIKNKKFGLGKGKQFFHIEYFTIDIKRSIKEGRYIYQPQFVLFNYMKRNPLNHDAKTKEIVELSLIPNK